jgi:hypothetical protein
MAQNSATASEDSREGWHWFSNRFAPVPISSRGAKTCRGHRSRSVAVSK